MTSVVTLTASSPDPCTEIPGAIPFSAPLTPAPFPNATGFSGSVPQFPGFAVSGACNTNCAGSPTSPANQVAVATSGALQAAALGSVAVVTTNVQTFNIGLRLAALRRGAPGVSASGLSLDLDGQSVPLAAVTSFLERGGGASADRSRLGLFVNGKGSFGNQDATPKDAGFDFNTAGVTLGADYRLTDQFLLGIALGYLRTKTTFDASAGESRIHGYSVSAYGNVYLTDKWYLDGIATFGWNDYDTERAVAPLGATAEGSTDGTQFALSV
ncbi:MAG: autotransporter outer membrane beta-barrel domain-containing protein, partial [Actinomycetota bacterium]